MDTIPNHLPQTDGWASTTLAQRYEQEVCNILAALGEINEGIKYSLVTDLTRFKDFSYNPHRPLNKKALNKVSKELGVRLSYNMTLVEVAEKLFNKNLDSRRRP